MSTFSEEKTSDNPKTVYVHKCNNCSHIQLRNSDDLSDDQKCPKDCGGHLRPWSGCNLTETRRRAIARKRIADARRNQRRDKLMLYEPIRKEPSYNTRLSTGFSMLWWGWR